MKSTFAPRTARALAPFLAATALVSIPAFAQDAAPQTAPGQPVIVTPPSSATVPIPPVVRTVPDGAPAPEAAAAEPAAKPAARAAAPRAATATRNVTRSTRTSTTTARTSAPTAPVAAPAPVAAEPVTPPSAPPVDTAASAPPAPPVAAPATEPAAPAADTASTDSTTTTSGVPVWMLLTGGMAALAIIIGALMAMRRRRREYEYDEPAYVEDTYVEPAPVAATPVIEPVAAAVPVARAEPRKEPEYLRRSAPVAPVETVIAAPDEVAMSTPPADEVAELTAGAAPAERPWLEFAMRPVRAGTNVDEALVEIELTVGNAGSVDARDVRISTFLLSGDVRSAEMDRLLTSPPSDATTDPVTIKPGEGKRIDATLALLKSDMGENLPDSIRPIVVADARYTLADGTEGRTSASFVIGVTPEEGTVLEPLEMNRSSMHENVAAELHGEPQHA